MINISVICPVYNSRNFVLKTIDSIINQSKHPYELIIVDDGSIDNTSEFLKEHLDKINLEFKWKILIQKHKGPGAARNTGIRESSGNWVAFIDSDDIWSENKIIETIKIIKSNSKLNFICHNEIFIDLYGNKEKLDYCSKYSNDKPLLKQLYCRNLFSTSAVICKKSLFDKIGGFDEKLMSSQDYDLWLKLSNDINLFFSDKYLGNYIQRKGNISSGNWVSRLRNEIVIANRYSHLVKKNIFLRRILFMILTSFYNFIRQK